MVRDVEAAYDLFPDEPCGEHEPCGEDELQVYHQEHRAVPVLDDQGCARRFAWLCFTLVLAGATFFATVYLLATL